MKKLCKIVGTNEFWTAIETETYNDAFAFKKFTRNKKRIMDEKKLLHYK